MIRRLSFYRGSGHDPHANLAVEQVLLESVTDQCILYLWQNENTVVIGRNQNPWKECRTALLSEEGGKLARRLSGGGAVFHDLGNLNFTFLMPQGDFDVEWQLSVILLALQSLGIPAEKSGRNDLLAAGRKFSGNAFYKNGHQAYHHGTLLVDADLEKLGRYLSPSKAKLKAKGVDSVRSRVGNLKELSPELTMEALEAALVDAFGKVYGLPVETLAEVPDVEKVRELTRRNRSRQWNFGHKVPFTAACEERFSWGGVQLLLQVEDGVIQSAKLYSDAMDWSWVEEVERALGHCPLDRKAISLRLEACGTDHAAELLHLFESQIL